MAKINSTYNAGYYYDKDVDIVAFNAAEEKIVKQKEKEKRQRLQRIQQKGGSGEGIVTDGIRVRQTFAVPFHTQCLHCNKRIARGVHVYMNRYKAQGEGEGKTDLGLEVWEIQFRCPNCSKHIYIRTDNDTPEKTGGYIPYKHCKRFAGDFLDMYKKEAAKAVEDAIEAAKAAATMSDAERRGLANKSRQDEQSQLEALIKRRSALTAEELLERLEAPERGESTSASHTSGFVNSLDGEDAELGNYDDEPSDSDEEGDVADIGHKRGRSEENHDIDPREEDSKQAALVMTSCQETSNPFLASLGAILGTTQLVPHSVPAPSQVSPSQIAPTEAPSAKKKAASKLKGKDLISSYFN